MVLIFDLNLKIKLLNECYVLLNYTLKTLHGFNLGFTLTKNLRDYDRLSECRNYNEIILSATTIDIHR